MEILVLKKKRKMYVHIEINRKYIFKKWIKIVNAETKNGREDSFKIRNILEITES